MEDNRLIETEEDQEEAEEAEEDYEEYEEGEELEELIPVESMIPSDSLEDEDYDDDGEEDYEEEEAEDLTAVGMPSQVAAVINSGFLDDLSNLESCEGKPANQETDEGGGGNQELNRGEIDGLLCPICFQAWTNGGEHRICCLPCGHIYGLSCIRKWLQRTPNSRKCPQCNSLCTLKDVIVLYTAGLCVADEKLQNKVQSLEAKCASLEQQRRDFETQRQNVMMHVEKIETSFKRHREKVEMSIREVETRIREMQARGYK